MRIEIFGGKRGSDQVNVPIFPVSSTLAPKFHLQGPLQASLTVDRADPNSRTSTRIYRLYRIFPNQATDRSVCSNM